MKPQPQCAVCGGKKTLGGGLCVGLCYWILEGWLGWDGKRQRVKFADSRATKLWALHRQSYPKLVRTARAMGWAGLENAATFPVVRAAKAKAAVAGSSNF